MTKTGFFGYYKPMAGHYFIHQPPNHQFASECWEYGALVDKLLFAVQDDDGAAPV